MEVYLYNSTVCRLCGEENDNGTLLYTNEENNQDLFEIINTYLPLKVSDDGQLPRTICPGCTIQLEATVEFFNLIIKGQKIIRELHQRETDYIKSISTEIPETNVIAEKIVYEINTSDGIYHVEHPISLQMSGMDKPKRKRGRPSKKPKSPEELAQEAAAAVAAKEEEARNQAEKVQDECHGKRRRKTPTRLRETVQGKELEKIFIEEGVIDKPDSESDIVKDEDDTAAKEPDIKMIGHVATSGEPVLVHKGKGRGRPKGVSRSRPSSQCAQCGMQFSSVSRYMSHVASHSTNPLFNPTNKHDKFIVKLEETHSDISISSEPVEEAEVKEELREKVEINESPGHAREEGGSDKIHDGDDTGEKSKPVTDSPNEGSEEETEVKAGIKRLKCKYCDKMFSSRQSKSMHTKAVHRGERPYACAECGVSFPYPRSLAVHALAHRRRRAAAAHAGYACDICGKILNHPSSVMYHKQSMHAAQRYVCGSCGKTFHHRQLLQRHQLVHSADRPHACEVCKASFKTKANLRNHMLLHSGVKKFTCDICKHKFSHKTSLTLHMRWHTGSKPFECKWCGKSFSQKGNQAEHERIHTGEKPYACTLCPSRFTTSSQHRLHAKRHHEREDIPEASSKRTPQRPSGGQEPTTEHELSRHTNDAPILKRVKKRVSLLVTDQEDTPPVCASPSPTPATAGDVIYVAYDVNSTDASTFQIIDPDQAANIEEEKVLATCELYTGASTPERLQVQPARGHSPIHFRMQDGTMLAVTSLDGETLQILTQDGQSIPVEVNEYEDNMVESLSRSESVESMIVDNSEVAAAEECGPGEQLAHYFTIV